MRVPIGIVGSVLGATIAFYLAIITLVTLPAEGVPRWFMVAGVTALSLVAGLIINSGSMQDFRRVSQGEREASNLYNTLTSRLNPLLCGGIEDVLQRRIKDVDLLKGLQMNVFAPIDGLYRVVGSTLPPGATFRQLVHEPNEGLSGFVATRQIAGYTRTTYSDPGQSDVYDRSGLVIGQRTPTREVNRGKTVVGGKWIYGRPIFEKSGAIPWSNKVVGVLTVNATADDADSLFRNTDFQSQMDSLASDISPYLDALQMLTAKDKVRFPVHSGH
jgi:hypothetical protein